MTDGGVAVIGAGRIGVPWAAVLSSELGIDTTCIDINEDRVTSLQEGKAPFSEPGLDEHLSNAVAESKLKATTNPSAIEDHQYVAFAVNASRNQMSTFLDIVREYAPHFCDDHIIINRATLPVDMIERMWDVIAENTDSSPSFTVFPERLAEGKAIEEIKSLPKIVGVTDDRGREAMRNLLTELGCDIKFTDPETAIFVKLIDNSYRDALFGIANQIGFTADQLGIDAHEAISLANYEYPRNNIPTPGPVGGKCLPKDPHFLTDERVCDQPTTPDLFTATRRTNASMVSYVVTQILRRRPSKAAILGLTYKRDVSDTYNSPAMDIYDNLVEQGLSVDGYDPHTESTKDIEDALDGADIVVLAVNHTEFRNVEATINEHAAENTMVYDLWGYLDRTRLSANYEGFGIPRMSSE